MTLSLQNTIPVVSLGRMPVAAKLRSNNFIANAGVNAVVVLAFSGGGAVNENFTIEYPKVGRQLVFTFVASPNTTGRQLPAYTAGAVADWVATLIPYLQYNYWLDKDYTIVASGADITITAIEKGTDYSMTVVNNVANMAVSTNTAGVNTVLRDNFETICDLYLQSVYAQDSNNFAIVSSQAMVPDDAGDCVFWLNKMIMSYLTGHFPAYAEDDIKRAAGAFAKWYVKYSEYYGDPPDYYGVTKSATFWSFRGGLRMMDWEDNDYFATWLTDSMRFLTWKSGVRIVTESQQEYLSYMISDATVTSLKLIVKMYYSDGTNSTEIALTQTSVVQKEIYVFPVGYDQLDIDVLKTAGKTVVKYDVWLHDQIVSPHATVISEIVTYKVDREDYEYRRVFYFENSLTGIDSLICSGKREDSIEIARMSMERIMENYWDEGASIGQGNIENYDNAYRQIYKISSGWKSKKEAIDEIREFMISRVIREDTEGKWVPVMLKGDTFRLYKDAEDAYYVEFEYFESFENVSYSQL